MSNWGVKGREEEAGDSCFRVTFLYLRGTSLEEKDGSRSMGSTPPPMHERRQSAAAGSQLACDK